MSTDIQFESSSSDAPQVLHLCFPDRQISLGCTLGHCDKGADGEMFLPGYATIAKILNNEGNLARRCGVQVGDVIVAVNGQGFRRFQADADLPEPKILQDSDNSAADANGDVVTLDHQVVPAGDAYSQLLAKIKAVKAGTDADTDDASGLVLTLERYGWDARPHSWLRFLAARDNEVPMAMQMMQAHELYKAKRFPISIGIDTNKGLRAILECQAVSEIDVPSSSLSNGEASNGDNDTLPPTVYVDYGKLLKMQAAGDITTDDVVAAFVLFTERMLAKSSTNGGDPRRPQTSQLIDMSGVSVMSGGGLTTRADTLKQIYNVFEPNYPETLYKMVMYPVSTMFATTARTLLSFVNEKTKQKFLITNKLDKVCTELGWNQQEVDECGGVAEFMRKHSENSTKDAFFAAPAENGTAEE